MVEDVSFERSSYQEAPLRFEAGTPMIGAAIGLKAAIEFLESLDREKIRESEKLLRERIESELRSMPKVRIFGGAKEKGPIVSFAVEGVHSLDLASMLDCKGIAIRSGHLCAQPLMDLLGCKKVCRASLGLYNTGRDVDLFLESLRSALDLLRN